MVTQQDMEKKAATLAAQLKKAEAEAAKLRTAEGDVRKLSDKLSHVNAEREILKTRLQATEQAIRNLKADELRGRIAKLEQQHHSTETKLLATSAGIERQLSEWFDEHTVAWLRHPGKVRAPTDQHFNRFTPPEEKLQAEMDNISRECTKLSKALAELEAA